MAPSYALVLFGLAVIMTGRLADGPLEILIFLIGGTFVIIGGLKLLWESGAPPPR
ncbi:MAG: hypothetical protein JWM76_1836 [Pseudonocardiales bacterium]|nr:hypothetical protein [Pseudonocardiales bacterium]